MIQIQKIDICKFRGIQELTLSMEGTNFAICGPNGTGKSGVVDAIEFALTGNISRLSGQGTGGLSVSTHGPHVDNRSNPEKASVSLTLKIISLDKEVTIERTVKKSGELTITPCTPEIKEIMEHVAKHPEFVLSRRELIRYILIEPGQRWKEVQALLRLNEIEALRKPLKKIHNKQAQDVRALKGNKDSAEKNLLMKLGIEKLAGSELLSAVNKRRTILDLPIIDELGKNTSIKDGLDEVSSAKSISSFPKIQALQEIKILQGHLDSLKEQKFVNSWSDVLIFLKDLNADADDLEKLTHENLLQIAVKNFDDERCPVCDTEWEPEKFKSLINKKIEHLVAIKKKKQNIEYKISPIISALEALSTTLTSVAKYGQLLPKSLDTQVFQETAEKLTNSTKQLRIILPLPDTIKIFETEICDINSISKMLNELKKAVSEIPDSSQKDTARDYLVLGQDNLETYRAISRELKISETYEECSRKVLEKYNDVVDAELNAIYKNVATTFRNFYRIINQDDEYEFEAELKSSTGKLDLDVDFYKRGLHPPGAYHSEGHQDGMGLCLYLALMKYLLDEEFTFAVLDDVLVSVDSGHRREVCKLLTQEFPNTQFIVTTHDDIWLRHMQTTGLIEKSKGHAQFKTWSVEIGPTEWSKRDIWVEIEDHLAKNEVRESAGLLRHYLEYFTKETCHYLRAAVPFHGDGQFTLGELMPPSVSRLKKLLNLGKNVLNSWGGEHEEKIKIEALYNAIDKAEKEARLDQWQINASIHYNEWATLDKNEFEPVVNSFKKLTELFRCQKCNGLLYVVFDKSNEESLRCNCGEININFVSKKVNNQ